MNVQLFLSSLCIRPLWIVRVHSQTMGDRSFQTWGDCDNQVLPTGHNGGPQQQGQAQSMGTCETREHRDSREEAK